ncbi:MAG: TylF/MycF/NovP-related O-methyltransferase [Rubinisphaera brasiliensis]|uniref:TylF/MycF/NovP-related O-methyltransferase n=1 Tax=Rubinisphaera brasiliensis TaxID=119 RepID=UPI00391BC516
MKYSLAKRLVSSVPGLRTFGARLFTFFPTAVSPYIYHFMRAVLFRDNAQRLKTFKVCFDKLAASGDAGDYLEFGVARGTSMISSHRLAKQHRLDSMRFFAFDSFAGLPSDEEQFTRGDMAYSQKDFSHFCEKAGVELSRVTPVPGFFEATLTDDMLAKLDIKPGRHIVHVDCDLYESTVLVLRFVEPVLEVGSIIMFDDWHSFDYKQDPENWGEQRAFGEWAEHEKFEKLAEHPDWNCAFIKTKA